MKSEILALKTGEEYVAPVSDYEKAKIIRFHFGYALYSIPMFGGTPILEGNFDLQEVDEIINLIESWT